MNVVEIGICIGVFLFFYWFLYVGAVGRMEGKNQFDGREEFLGKSSPEERYALMSGNHKRMARKQALFGASVFTVILFVILLFV